MTKQKFLESLTDDEKHNFLDLSSDEQLQLLDPTVSFDAKVEILSITNFNYDFAKDEYACCLCKNSLNTEELLRTHIESHLRRAGIEILKKQHSDECDCVECRARTEKGGLDHDPSSDDEEFEEHERQVFRDKGIDKEVEMSEARRVYFLLDSQRDENNELIVLIAIENESGYYKTDWHWGTDIDVAEKIARKKNEKLGISEDEAHKVVLSTMRKGAIEKLRF